MNNNITVTIKRRESGKKKVFASFTVKNSTPKKVTEFIQRIIDAQSYSHFGDRIGLAFEVYRRDNTGKYVGKTICFSFRGSKISPKETRELLLKYMV